MPERRNDPDAGPDTRPDTGPDRRPGAQPPRNREDSPASDWLHGGYSLFDARSYGGGDIPYSGYGGQGYHRGNYDPGVHHGGYPGHKPNWTDSFPHSFSGWGPQAPDYSHPDPARDLGYAARIDRGEDDRNPARGRFRPSPDFDDSYLTWRAEQMRKLDEDYIAWRREKHSGFSEDFEAWRRSRANPPKTRG